MPSQRRSNTNFAKSNTQAQSSPAKGQGKPNIAHKAIQPELVQTFPNILLLFLRRLTAEYASFSQTLILTENESPHALMIKNNLV